MRPDWYDNCARRGETDDDVGRWCRRTCEAIDAGTPLYVTPAEYEELRTLFVQGPQPEPFGGEIPTTFFGLDVVVKTDEWFTVNGRPVRRR